MTYQDAQAKLLAYVRDRIHNGEFTERGLARLIGISQPHLHNVLKGARNLSAEILDSILEYFQLSFVGLSGGGGVGGESGTAADAGTHGRGACAKRVNRSGSTLAGGDRPAQKILAAISVPGRSAGASDGAVVRRS